MPLPDEPTVAAEEATIQTEYAQAAKYYYEKGLANPEKNHVGPLSFFIEKDPTISQFPYGPIKKK